MQRNDHHDWASEAYVDEWVSRQQAEDPRRAERFQFMCDLFPFPDDATDHDPRCRRRLWAGQPIHPGALSERHMYCPGWFRAYAQPGTDPHGDVWGTFHTVPIRSLRCELVAKAVWPLRRRRVIELLA